MPTFNHDNTHYYYERHGTGRSLLLLHGFTGSSVNWQTCIPRLPPHFEIVTLDLLGHGKSAIPQNPERYAMKRTAADLAALVRENLSPPVDLLGYSMGGRLALYVALHYPKLVRSLILESASPGLTNPDERQVRREQDEKLAGRIESEGIKAFVDFWEGISLFESQRSLPEPVRAALRKQRHQNSAQGLANSLRGMGTGIQPSLWERLPELKMSVLFLTGELDTKFVGIARRMVDRVPDGKLEIIPGAGHTVHLEKPDEFCRAISSFIG